MSADFRKEGQGDDRLAQIRARCERATDGPWKHDTDYLGGGIFQERVGGWAITRCHGYGPDSDHERMPADAEFIAHSREDVPYLLERVENLEQAWRRDRELYSTAIDNWRARLEEEKVHAANLKTIADGAIEDAAALRAALGTLLGALRDAILAPSHGNIAFPVAYWAHGTPLHRLNAMPVLESERRIYDALNAAGKILAQGKEHQK